MAHSNPSARTAAELLQFAVDHGHTTHEEVLRAIAVRFTMATRGTGSTPDSWLRQRGTFPGTWLPTAPASPQGKVPGVSDVASLLADLIVNIPTETRPEHGRLRSDATYVAMARGLHRHALFAASPALVDHLVPGAIPEDLLERLQSRVGGTRPSRKGLRAEVLKGVEHNAAGGVSAHAPYVTIISKDGQPLPVRFQQQEPTRDAPAVSLWRRNDVWVARPALTGDGGHYGPSGAHVTRQDGLLTQLVGATSIALHDKPDTCPLCTFGTQATG